MRFRVLTKATQLMRLTSTLIGVWSTRRFTSAVTMVGLAAAAAVVLPTSAAAASPTAHDPIGNTPTVSSVAGGIRFSGWALDPDSVARNVTVAAIVDGRTIAASAPTSVRWTTVTTKYRSTATPGYVLTVPLDKRRHTVCLVERNTGAGLDTVKKCVATPLGTTLTAGQLAAHDPVGAMTAGWANARSVHYTGWTSDPDFVARSVLVVLYVDNQPVATRATTANPGPRAAAAGPNSKFDILVPVSTVGTHVGCLWVVDVGFGANTFLGCKVVDNRSPAGRPKPAMTPAPALNALVLAEAKKHLGARYVFGAAGPTNFDCSGLMKWSYGKYKFTTPRVSEDQITAARLIPASHAQPGDLVFYHDTQGDVYHVGMFVRPGMTVAAVDPQEGVRYQAITDSTATYGSFTHT